MASHRIRHHIEALEVKVIVKQRETLPGLVALWLDCKLDMGTLSHEQLWWLMIGKEDEFPGWSEFKRWVTMEQRVERSREAWRTNGWLIGE
jgi:hypothetical protein